MQIGAYIRLAKPGILLGNSLTAAGGFALASRGEASWSLFALMLCGLIGIIASACALNNYIDRCADAQMPRTQKRPLPAAVIPSRHALYFAAIAFLLGAVFLVYLPWLAAACAWIGFLLYVCVYSFMKYHSPYSTHIGSIAGAMPPLVGYFAVVPRVDLAAGLLFVIVALWQMPHFFAISLYRQEEYATASIPVFSLSKGVEATRRQMFFYVAAFFAASLSLFFFHYTGVLYFCSALGIGILWLALCLKGFTRTDTRRWARRMFLFSLAAIMTFCLVLWY